MPYEKKPLKDKVKPDKSDKKKFTIEASAASEQNIILVFRSDEDADKAKQIDKLSVMGLPKSGGGADNITWLNNFWLKKADGKYLDGVEYGLQINQEMRTSLVYFNGQDVLAYTGPKTDLGNGWIEITLNIGDPGIGVTT